jgi:hypothetical protein
MSNQWSSFFFVTFKGFLPGKSVCYSFSICHQESSRTCWLRSKIDHLNG